MAFPLTKYAVVGVFTVVFIFAIDALTPMELFYEVYTEHNEEVKYVIEKASYPIFEEANDALCRCLIETTGVEVSPTNKSIHAFFTVEPYTFLYEKPKNNVQAILLACSKNQESPKLYVAFSINEDEYFNVRISKLGPVTGRVYNILRVPGLEDNDQKILSQSPYWCHVAAEIRHNVRAQTLKKKHTVARMTEEEKESYVESLFENMISSAKKNSDKWLSNNKHLRNGSQIHYQHHTDTETNDVSVVPTENQDDILNQDINGKSWSRKGPGWKTIGKIKASIRKSMRNELSNDNDKGKELQSVVHTENEIDILAKIANGKRIAHKLPTVSVSKKIDNPVIKTSYKGLSSDYGQETESQSVVHTEKIDILAKIAMGESIARKLPTMSVSKEINDPVNETSYKGLSCDYDQGTESQSVVHTENEIDILAKIAKGKKIAHKRASRSVSKIINNPAKKISYKGLSNDNDQETEYQSIMRTENQIDILAKIAKGKGLSKQRSRAIFKKNNYPAKKTTYKGLSSDNDQETESRSVVQNEYRYDKLAKVTMNKRPSYKLPLPSALQMNNESDEKTSDEWPSDDNNQENHFGNPFNEAKFSHAPVKHTKNERNNFATIPQKKMPSYKLPLSISEKKYDSDDMTSDEGPSNEPPPMKPSKGQIEIHSDESTDTEEGRSNINDWENRSRRPDRYRTATEINHVSAAQTKNKKHIAAKIPKEKMPSHKLPLISVLQKNNDSDEESSDEERSNHDDQEKLIRSTYSCGTAAEASHASVVHTKKNNDIITKKIPQKIGPSYKLPSSSVLERNNDSDDETSDEGASNVDDRKKLSQNTYLSRTSAEPNHHISIAHTKKNANIVSNITKEKRILYSPPLNDSDEETLDVRQPLPTKPSRGMIETKSVESSDADERPSNHRLPMKPSKGPIRIESDESSDV